MLLQVHKTALTQQVRRRFVITLPQQIIFLRCAEYTSIIFSAKRALSRELQLATHKRKLVSLLECVANSRSGKNLGYYQHEKDVNS